MYLLNIMKLSIMVFFLQINYGSLLLQALLEHWPLTHTHTSNDEVIKGNEYFSVPKHTPVIFR